MNPKSKRILFLGTPEISARLLEALILDGFNIVGVVTKVDAPVGRKQVLTPPPVKTMAEKYGIPVNQFVKVRDGIDVLERYNADAIVCIAYGQIVPEVLLNTMKIGSLNFHGSLLPKYRGAAPLQRAIMCGENVSGVTAMEMVKAMDAGKMYAKLEIPIAHEDTYSSYREKFITAVIPFALNILPQYLSGALTGLEQNEADVTFAPMISKEECHLTCSNGVESFINTIRGLSDEPGAFLNSKKGVLKIFQASRYSSRVIAAIGNINKCDKDGFVLQLNDGEVKLEILQLPGKNRLFWRDFINGNKDFLDTILE